MCAPCGRVLTRYRTSHREHESNTKFIWFGRCSMEIGISAMPTIFIMFNMTVHCSEIHFIMNRIYYAPQYAPHIILQFEYEPLTMDNMVKEHSSAKSMQMRHVEFKIRNKRTNQRILFFPFSVFIFETSFSLACTHTHTHEAITRFVVSAYWIKTQDIYISDVFILR